MTNIKDEVAIKAALTHVRALFNAVALIPEGLFPEDMRDASLRLLSFMASGDVPKYYQPGSVWEASESLDKMFDWESSMKTFYNLKPVEEGLEDLGEKSFVDKACRLLERLRQALALVEKFPVEASSLGKEALNRTVEEARSEMKKDNRRATPTPKEGVRALRGSPQDQAEEDARYRSNQDGPVFRNSSRRGRETTLKKGEKVEYQVFSGNGKKYDS